MVLAERLEVDAESHPLSGPLEPPRKFPLAERRRCLGTTALYLSAARREPGADVADGPRVDVDLPHVVRQTATLGALGHEWHVVIGHVGLIFRQHLVGGVALGERCLGCGLERS